MRFSVWRYFSPSIRSRRWIIFLSLGVLMFAFSIMAAILFVLIVHPAGLETARSFHPIGLSFAALAAILIALYWFLKGINSAFHSISVRDHEASERIRELVFQHKKSGPLPSLVALGGGTGLSTLLKGLKEFPLEVTAVVTVTDDGGSSGRLRKDMQILPPGDVRNCLVALSQSESLLSRLFQHRFEEAGEITGHSFGNLFLAAMTNLLGDFNSAVREASNILAIRGKVLPVTCDFVQLSAKFSDGTECNGETAITHAGKRIIEISLHPHDALANPEALSAIDQASLIILGPGSLFTSVIPNLLVNDIADRINNSKTPVVYICNVMTQPGETDKFTAADHVAAIFNNTRLRRITYVLVNSRRAAKPLRAKYEDQGQYWVPPTVTRIEEKGIRVLTGDFLTETDLVRHNPTTLALAILRLMKDVSDNWESTPA